MATILEAAAQILEAGGLAAFTTNAVAERAGVSIGTLYQYFADKNAHPAALAEREMRRTLAGDRQALRGETRSPVEDRVRAMVRAMVNAFGGRQRARKAVIAGDPGAGRWRTEMMGPVAAFLAAVDRIGTPAAAIAPLTREQVFVLSRALMGTIRAAVLEEQPFLRSRPSRTRWCGWSWPTCGTGRGLAGRLNRAMPHPLGAGRHVDVA